MNKEQVLNAIDEGKVVVIASYGAFIVPSDRDVLNYIDGDTKAVFGKPEWDTDIDLNELL